LVIFLYFCLIKLFQYYDFYKNIQTLIQHFFKNFRDGIFITKKLISKIEFNDFIFILLQKYQLDERYFTSLNIKIHGFLSLALLESGR